MVRHGQTLWNAQGRLTGWADVPLSPLGREQARRLGVWLQRERFDRVVASDLQRAVETAHLAYAEPEERLWALREIDFGELDGLLWAELPEEHRQALLRFDGFQAPGGESVEGFRSRVHAALSALPEGRLLVFTHGGVLRLVLRELGQEAFLPPCSVVGVDWEAQRLLFVREG